MMKHRRAGGRDPCRRLLCTAAAAFGAGLLLGLFCSLRLALVCAALLLMTAGISLLTAKR